MDPATSVPPRSRGISSRLITAALVAIELSAACAPTGDAGDRWVAAWRAAPQLTEPRNMPPVPLEEGTLRQAFRVSLGGGQVRVRVSNEYGEAPLEILEARLARYIGAGRIELGSARTLSFGGEPEVTVQAGGRAISDPLDFSLEALDELAFTVELGRVPAALTGHPGSRTTSYVVPAQGSGASDPLLTTDHWYLVTGIDVVAPEGAAVAILGNSITDGRGSTTNGNDRWPDVLAERLQADPATARVAVLNQGIGGNCVVRDCLGPPGRERFTRDILDPPGARWAIVFEGINDIGGTETPAGADSVAEALVEAYQAMISDGHDRGITVYGATLLPFGGSVYDTPARERARQRVNEWIRAEGVFDAVIDFDAVLRDPDEPTRLRSDADSGDGLHPNAAGYRLMGEAIDLGLFRGAAAPEPPGDFPLAVTAGVIPTGG